MEDNLKILGLKFWQLVILHGDHIRIWINYCGLWSNFYGPESASGLMIRVTGIENVRYIVCYASRSLHGKSNRAMDITFLPVETLDPREDTSRHIHSTQVFNLVREDCPSDQRCKEG
jgi:hypothetical protein